MYKAEMKKVLTWAFAVAVVTLLPARASQVAAWGFEEGSGLTYENSSGTASAAAPIYNGAGIAVGSTDAMVASGTSSTTVDSTLNANEIPGFGGTSACTILFAMSTVNTGKKGTCFNYSPNSGNNAGTNLRIFLGSNKLGANAIRIEASSGAAGEFVPAGITLNDGQAHFIAVILAGGEAFDDMDLYIDGIYFANPFNGQPSNNANMNLAGSGDTITFGCDYNGKNCFNGIIDDVAIYDEALATAELDDLRTNGLPLIPLTAPVISSFAADPDEIITSGDVELSWETGNAGRLVVEAAGGTSAVYTATADGQSVLNAGSLILGGVSTTTTYTITATIAEDGSGETATAQATVTVSLPGPGTDSDQDGLPDLDETHTYFTDAKKRDSDGDGTPDGLEVEHGLDPNNPNEYLDRPNILFFFVDDLGYGDLGCFWQDQKAGSQKFDTPHIDLLAAGGAKLTHHYVSAPVCAPTRASLIQGRHQGHADVRNNQFDAAIPDNHTVADMLRRAGYRTIHVGKNGVAGGEGSVTLTGTGSQDLAGHPLKRGFDDFFGYLFHGDGHEHYPQNGGTLKTAHIYDGYRQVKDASADLYTTDAWTAYAKKLIVDEVQDGDHQPFFLYLAYDTPHFKMQRPAVEYPAGGGLNGGIQWTTATGVSNMVRYASTAVGDGTNDVYNHPENDPAWPISNQQHVGMIRRIDNSMGDVLQLLEDLGIVDNTLVIFSSDNGPHNEGNDPRYFESFADMEGTKRDMLEAGIRVPTIVNWPNRIAGATGDTNQIHEIDYPSAVWDWMPTFADMAAVSAPAWCDGVSLLPTLTGTGVQRDKGYLYFEYYHNSSTASWSPYFPNHAGERRDQMQCVRIGDYMGIRTDIAAASDDFSIYNVVSDPGQGSDLAASLPELHQTMKDIALQDRRIDSSAVRPYDSVDIPNASRSVYAGLDYAVYEGIWSYVPEFRDLTAVATGTVTEVDLSVRSRDAHVGLLFTGYIDIPVADVYTFYLTADSGADLFIHDGHVIDDDFNHDGSEQSGTVGLAVGLHPIRLYYRHGKAEEHRLDFSWSSTGISKQTVPSSNLFRLPEIHVALDAPSASELFFSWNSTTGQSYRVLSSESLLLPRSSWSNSQTGIITTPPTNTLIIPAVGSQQFYSVEEE